MEDKVKNVFQEAETKNEREESTTNTATVIPADADVASRDEDLHSHHHHHSRHSHHRHHHRHHRSRSSKKKDSKWLRFLKKHRSLLVNILSCTVSVVLLLLLAAKMDFRPSADVRQPVAEHTQSTVKIETSIYPDEVSLVSKAIDYYMTGNTSESATEVYRSFDGYQSKLNEGVPLAFTCGVTGVPMGVSVQRMQLEISENEGDDKPRIYTFHTDRANVDLCNLKTGTAYEYRVSLTLSNGCELRTNGSFQTATSPRILKIDGAVNVRDIGGWKTADGKEVRQGLLYRGSELDGAVQPEYTITDLGLQQMIGDLGIRFDMDLRDASENKSGIDALGKNVQHTYYGVGVYSDIFDQGELVKNLFTDLADPDNYPIYLHCTHGRDRTGTVCYLLEALLGVSDEDLMRDYELSAFTDSYVNMAEFETFVERIQLLEGGSTQQKVENYLLSVGVTPEQIKTIQEMFLGK